MNTIIKLKNTDLIRIDTDWGTETLGNFTLQETINTSDIEFLFSNGDRFVMTMTDIDLCHLLGFFYGKDFSDISARQMCLEFVKYTGTYDLQMNGVNVLNCYYFENETCNAYVYQLIDGTFMETERLERAW